MPEEFLVNGEIVIYGKNIRIYDCDEYTREFYEVHPNIYIYHKNYGNPQPKGDDAVKDNWAIKT